MQRIWTEYPSGLLDLREDDLRAADPSTTYGAEKAVEEKDDEQRESGTLMTPEEMEALRSEVVADLNTARNELWWILELAKTLSASGAITSDPPPEPIPSAPARKGKMAPPKAAPVAAASAVPGAKTDEVPPILPPGTYSTTPAAAPERPTAQAAHELELALAAKAAALDDCAALIDAAVDELRLMNDAGTRWSEDIRALRLGSNGGKAHGQWAVVPKPDFGRTGESAKDVVIPYALDEAPPALHARSLAAFDLDPRKASQIAFGARSFLRLRVLFRTGGTGGPQSASTPYDASKEAVDASAEDIAATLAAAQLETVDEDLFAELRKEAIRLDVALVEPQNISLRIGKDKLTFQLVCSLSAASLTAVRLPHTAVGLPDLGALRRAPGRSSPGPAAQVPAAQAEGDGAEPRPVAEHALPTRQRAAVRLHVPRRPDNTGDVRGRASWVRAPIGAGGAVRAMRQPRRGRQPAGRARQDRRLRSGVHPRDRGVVSQPPVGHADTSPGLTVTVTAPASLTVTTPKASFPLRDVDALAPLAADAITEQLSVLAFPIVRDAAVGRGADAVFFDELDEVVVAGSLGPVL